MVPVLLPVPLRLSPVSAADFSLRVTPLHFTALSVSFYVTGNFQEEGSHFILTSARAVSPALALSYATISRAHFAARSCRHALVSRDDAPPLEESETRTEEINK